METMWYCLGASAVTLAFWGGIGLLVWLDVRSRTRQRELEHAERMAALEKGLPLPDADLAWAAALNRQATGAAVVTVLISFFLLAAALTVTGIQIWMRREEGEQAFLPTSVLYVVWGLCGFLVMTTVSQGLAVLSSLRSAKPPEPNPKPDTPTTKQAEGGIPVETH